MLLPRPRGFEEVEQQRGLRDVSRNGNFAAVLGWSPDLARGQRVRMRRRSGQRESMSDKKQRVSDRHGLAGVGLIRAAASGDPCPMGHGI
jgi:hypothetical protein